MSISKRYSGALAAIMVIAGLASLTPGEVVPNPDELAFKLGQTRVARTAPDRDLKANPDLKGEQPALGPRDQALWEGFEDGVIPPSGWMHIQYHTDKNGRLTTTIRTRVSTVLPVSMVTQAPALRMNG